MITQEHLKIYKKYHGNGDALAQVSMSREKELMDYKHWSLIDGFMQDLFLVKNGKVSASFIEIVDKRLKECCDTESTVQVLKDMALF
ncbi:hypothetical protein [Bacteroides congonensis]|uniref:hypothetical protein n=1 Tax=Bacteroides congonensis TaxID=1871006 RepID=UPI003A872617